MNGIGKRGNVEPTQVLNKINEVGIANIDCDWANQRSALQLGTRRFEGTRQRNFGPVPFGVTNTEANLVIAGPFRPDRPTECLDDSFVSLCLFHNQPGCATGSVQTCFRFLSINIVDAKPNGSLR